MPEPRIVTPEEAQEVLADLERHRLYANRYDDFAHTVATEPDRTRAAVVKALRGEAAELRHRGDHHLDYDDYMMGKGDGLRDAADALDRNADVIENGADHA